jgi:ketosteroid isomerase-like protein
MVALATISVYSQKNKNGKVYDEHPAIKVVEAVTKAFMLGDTAKMASLVADDYKQLDGSSTNPNQKGTNKKQLMNNSLYWKNNYDYLEVVRQEGTYPDAVEYKDGQVWVQTWDILKGVHNKSGIKLNMPWHGLWLMDDDNKVSLALTYYDERVFAKINSSYETRTNGKIYNEHKNINTVRRMFYALENNDFDKAYSFFTENARIRNCNMPVGETLSISKDRELTEQLFEQFNDINFQQARYPNYIEYERYNERTVQSFWNIHMTRKSNNKKIVLPFLAIHLFDKNGKIIKSFGYYSAKMLE